MIKEPKILVYGYGNPGRMDDGLGPVFTELVSNWVLINEVENISVDSNYQMNIEDAYSIRDYDIVIFVDATVGDVADFKLEELAPSGKVSFTMHAVSPAFVLDLCEKLFRTTPAAYMLEIKGYEFELKEELTLKAKKNLNLAFNAFQELIKNPSILLKTTLSVRSL